MSAESGIPTFRDRFEGLWANYDPQAVATPEAFRAHPQFVWDWHVHLAQSIRCAKPNEGHLAVARLQSLVPEVVVITQNIDSLHQAAGSTTVLELHGNLFRLKPFVDEDALFVDGNEPMICPVCDSYALADECDPYSNRDDFDQIQLKDGSVPHCPGCNAFLRPDIVWFGESLDPETLNKAYLVAASCDAMICIGSSLEVQPAASLPWQALERGALVIEINLNPTDLSAMASASLVGPAAVILPQVLERIWGE
jgi:NAD-dependent deacetylase